jgi:hypothetical protein
MPSREQYNNVLKTPSLGIAGVLAMSRSLILFSLEMLKAVCIREAVKVSQRPVR